MCSSQNCDSQKPLEILKFRLSAGKPPGDVTIIIIIKVSCWNEPLSLASGVRFCVKSPLYSVHYIIWRTRPQDGNAGQSMLRKLQVQPDDCYSLMATNELMNTRSRANRTEGRRAMFAGSDIVVVEACANVLQVLFRTQTWQLVVMHESMMVTTGRIGEQLERHQLTVQHTCLSSLYTGHAICHGARRGEAHAATGAFPWPCFVFVSGEYIDGIL